MQSVGESHFISQTKDNMIKMLSSQHIKSKIDELIRQQGTVPEMKGEPGLIPFSGGSSSMVQIRTDDEKYEKLNKKKKKKESNVDTKTSNKI